MNRLIFLLLLILSQVGWAQQPLILPIIEVHDGDTIKTSLPLPAPLNEVAVRIAGIDTPELPAKSYPTTGKLGRAECAKEAEIALEAKRAVEDIANNGSRIMTVTNYGYGKFAGRFVGDVSINSVDIATFLINHGYAVPYDGRAKTYDWCQ